MPKNVRKPSLPPTKSILFKKGVGRTSARFWQPHTSVLIGYCASVPINFQQLHKRVIDRDDVGGNAADHDRRHRTDAKRLGSLGNIDVLHVMDRNFIGLTCAR